MNIREWIFELADEKYREFHSKLCPHNDNIIGVRVPLIRGLAKEISKGDWRAYLKSAESMYYEEVMLQGMIIGNAKADADEKLEYIIKFVPKIDNWGVCDSFCSSLKFTNKNMEKVWGFIQPYLFSEKEFEVRFGVIMLLDYYLTDKYIDRVIELLDKVKHKGYYVKMSVAWAVSVAYIKFPKKTMSFLKDNTLDKFTYNKALQKILESYRVDKESKVLIRAMKLK